MIEQEKLPEWIDRFNRNDLNEEEMEIFLRHMEEDPQLRKEVMLDRELNSILEDQDILELRKKILLRKKKNEQSRNRFLLVAAFMILVAALIVLYQIVMRERPGSSKEEMKILAQDTVLKIKTDTAGNELPTQKLSEQHPETLSRQSEDRTLRENARELYAGYYKPFPPFESLVGTVTRAGYFKLIEPTRFIFRKDASVKFSWETSFSETLTLKILDNKGFGVREAKFPPDGNWVLNCSGLHYGLYYLKILLNDEIVYFGKFEVE
jgi:hypothetical protein